MRILLFGHTYQPSRSEQIRHVLQTLSRTEAELVAHGDFYDFYRKNFPMFVIESGDRLSKRLYCRYGIEYRRGRYFPAGCRKIGDRGIPVLGVNIGRLGF